MPESTIEPQTIEIVRIKIGIADILVHWDVQQEERTDEMSGKTQTIYTYEEQRLDWVLPRPMQTREEVEAYLASIEDELLDWAKGSQVYLIEETIVMASSKKKAEVDYLKAKSIEVVSDAEKTI